jgi:ribonuclease HI
MFCRRAIEMKLHVYTDGAARGNPGRSASGYYIFDGDHGFMVKSVFYNGLKTNNVAEYLAITAALKKVGREYGYRNEVIVCSDSRLVINQLNKKYRVKDRRLMELCAEATRIANRFDRCEFTNASRENRYISMVDRELNELLDKIKKERKSNELLGDTADSQKKLF